MTKIHLGMFWFNWSLFFLFTVKANFAGALEHIHVNSTAINVTVGVTPFGSITTIWSFEQHGIERITMAISNASNVIGKFQNGEYRCYKDGFLTETECQEHYSLTVNGSSDIIIAMRNISDPFFKSYLISVYRGPDDKIETLWLTVCTKACIAPGDTINATSGQISSPNFPNNYDTNRICTWNITVPGGKIIKLTFLNFTLVAGENDDCAGAAADSARVFIIDIASHRGKPNDFKICGQKLPAPVYSEGNFIQVRFESSTGPVNKGFNATFEAIDGDSLCPTDMILNETSGSFSSPFNPRNYPFNKTCSWKIIGKQGHRVELTIPDYNLEHCGGAACSCDYMEVQNSFSDEALPGKLCGTSKFIPVKFYSLHESLRVVFVSNNANMDYDGFEATYKLLNYSPPICPTEAIPLSGSGKISSPNYPKSNYTASRNCTWKITGPANKIVKFRFTDFVLSECSANPCLDSCSYVELYDGWSTSSPLLGRFCQGSSWNETQLSTGNKMFVMFHPGQTVDQGFEAKYDSTMTSVDQKTGRPPATGTGNRNEAIIYVPIVVPAALIVIALLSRYYLKRNRGQRGQRDTENIIVQMESCGQTVESPTKLLPLFRDNHVYI